MLKHCIIFILLLGVYKANGQNSLLLKGDKIVLDDNPRHSRVESEYIPRFGAGLRNSYNKKFDYLIVDGLIMPDKPTANDIPDSLMLIRKLVMNHPEALETTGFKYPLRGIDLFESETTHFYDFIVGNYRDKTLPLKLWGYRIPMLLNGQLIVPSRYSVLNDLPTTSVRSVAFKAWDAEELKAFDNLAFGAFIVTTQ